MEQAQANVSDPTLTASEREWNLKLIGIMKGDKPKDPVNMSKERARIEGEVNTKRAKIHQQHAVQMANFDKSVLNGTAGEDLDYGTEGYETYVNNAEERKNMALKEVTDSGEEQVKLLSGKNPEEWVNKYTGK